MILKDLQFMMVLDLERLSFLKGVHCVVNGVKIQKDYLQKEGYFISKIVVFIVNDVNSLQLKNK